MTIANAVVRNNRIQVVDALRGFALLGIVLIHYVEHFELFKSPEFNFLFSAAQNQVVFETVFFLISGKAYSIFAIMFGFSFFIQLNRREKKGSDFRLVFAWRLLLLLLMGVIHSLIYRGDILHIYAILGLFLIFFYKVPNKLLLFFAVLFAVQIPIVYQLFKSITVDGFNYVQDWGGDYGANCEEAYAFGSFWDVIKVNIWEGRYIVWAWTYYSGRFVQLFSLFLIGLYFGRKHFFQNNSKYQEQFKMILMVVALIIAIFHIILIGIEHTNWNWSQKLLSTTLFTSYLQLGYTALILIAFLWLSNKANNSKVLKYLAIYGRMSLTNYVSQAVFGVFLFYGFGLGMYNYWGAIWSLMAGVLFFVFQLKFSEWWLNNYYYGPLEWLWRSLTFMDFNLKFKKSKILIMQ